MEPKTYCEHRFVLEREGLHFDVFLKTYSRVMGYGPSRSGNPTYGDPVITVKVGGKSMAFGPFQGADPAMTEAEARQYVQRNIGPFGGRLSREAIEKHAQARRQEW